MNEAVHGHEILEHLIAAGGTMPLANLVAFADGTFGSDAKYFTCSAQGMNFEELLGFLLKRNKVVVEQGLITVRAENMCRDGDAHGH